jgi:hypothetical protein
MSNPLYSEQVGMYELSRIVPRTHVIDSIAKAVLEAAYVGADLLDGELDDDAMMEAWAKGHPDGFIATLRNIARVAVCLPPDDPDGRWRIDSEDTPT